MKQICLLISILTLHFHLMAQPAKCTHTIRYDYLKTRLDPSICIPPGNHIISIDANVDLNNDGVFDKVVRWQKINLADGDTVFYSIYFGSKDGRFSLGKTLTNLKPLYFRNYDLTSENKFYDSIRRRYIYADRSIVEFEPQGIGVTFYVKHGVVERLFFSYSSQKNTWILSREMRWLAPSRYKSERKIEIDRAPERAMVIDEFNMLECITPTKDQVH